VPTIELAPSSSSSSCALSSSVAAAAPSSPSLSKDDANETSVGHATAGRICPLCSYAQPFLLSDAPLVSTGSALAEQNTQDDATAREVAENEDGLLQHAINLSAAGEASSGADSLDNFEDWTCEECTCVNAATADCCEACAAPRDDSSTAVVAPTSLPASLHFEFTSRGLAVGTQVAKLVAGYGPLRGVVVECRLDPSSGAPSCVIEDRCKAWLQPLDDDDENNDNFDDGNGDEDNGMNNEKDEEEAEEEISGGKNSGNEDGDTKRQRTSEASSSTSSSSKGTADTATKSGSKRRGQALKSSPTQEAAPTVPAGADNQMWRSVREVFDLEAVVQEAELAKVLGPCNATILLNPDSTSTSGGILVGSAGEAKTNTEIVGNSSSRQSHRFHGHGNGLVSGFGSKVDAVVAELRALKRQAPGTKSLVFSQWADALTLLRHALTANSISSLLLTGDSKAVDTLHKFRATTESSSTSTTTTTKKSKSKNSAKDNGISEPWNGPIDVLLMPLKATNAGLSLNEATHVFLLDTTLNRGLETQALARVRRINSTQSTIVHRFVMCGTIEEAIWDLLKQSQEGQQHEEEGDHKAGSSLAASVNSSGRSNDSNSAPISSSPSSSSTGTPHEIRRCDVHRLLTNLRDLYRTDPAAMGAEKKGKDEPTHRPAWRARFLKDLKDFSE
jgi:hypothetical protein